MPTEEENKASFRRYLEEAWNQSNLEVVDEIFDRYVSHQPDGSTLERDPEDVKRFVDEFRSAFPDLRLSIEEQLAEGDKVVSHGTIRGTHQGEFRGMAPTGEEREIKGMAIFRFSSEGKVVESWDSYDQLSLMRQSIEQELRMARSIQQALLPQDLPHLEGWQITPYYQPAREVGGDFYDFFELEDGRVGVVEGDATGKGMPAALVASATCSMLRAVAQAVVSSSPGEVLARVNETLLARIPPNMFVTCFYAILDPKTGSLSYANAGHDLPYLWRGGDAEELRARGMPLGLLPGMEYEEKEIELDAGEGVLFYTDGLVEAHVALVGPGGMGKTRVGLQAAAELLEEFEGGVFFVALATIADPTLVASSVAQALGVTETGDQPLEEKLKEYLRERETLLLLDNFEQVMEATPLLEGFLAAAPRLKVLATSRAALRLYGEHEFPVPPLQLLDTERLPQIEALSQYEAVRLFIERARALKPDFAITNENAHAVAEICARLDGLPLAIELAAARIRLLPPNAMLARLGSRLKLLTGGARNLPERQRTLRGAIEWSHELLTLEEQILFARLAVFSGGRTLEAIEAVCDPEGELDIFGGVESLLEKSLLRQEEGPEGEPRFVMLETIHEYARERLQESGEAEEIKRAHAEYFLALAEKAEPKQHGLEEQAWLYRPEAEHDNMRAALSWSLGGGDMVVGLRLAGALGWFWFVRGHFSEGRGWLEEGLTKVGDEAPADARARALVELGNLATEQGDFERAKDSCKEAITIHRDLGDKKGLSYSLGILGWATMYQGDDARATALLEECLAVALESAVEWTIDYALISLSVMAGDRGDFGQAEAFWEEALVHARKRRDRRFVVTVLYNMGFAEAVRGDYERATALFEECLAIGRELRNTYGVALSLMSVGLASTRRGDHGRARVLLGESLVLSRELGLKVNVAECLEILSGMAGELEDIPRAARLWGVADALREAIGAPWLPLERRLYEPYLDAIRSRADEAVWTKAWEEEQAMPLEEAIAYALEEEDRG